LGWRPALNRARRAESEAGDSFGADGGEYLTAGELKILARMEREFSSSDPRLVDALSVGVRPVPGWLVGIARFALLMMVLVPLFPFMVWSTVVVLSALILVFRLLPRDFRG
jgi:hypothetical protein